MRNYVLNGVVSKEDIYNGVDKGISRDKKMETLYDREKFRKTYEEEMNKMGE
jgi:hypothetical protein